MITPESRALTTLSMASCAFCVAMRSPGELFVFSMPWVNTAAVPRAPTLSTPSAMAVSTSDMPFAEETRLFMTSP